MLPPTLLFLLAAIPIAVQLCLPRVLGDYGGSDPRRTGHLLSACLFMPPILLYCFALRMRSNGDFRLESFTICSLTLQSVVFFGCGGGAMEALGPFFILGYVFTSELMLGGGDSFQHRAMLGASIFYILRLVAFATVQPRLVAYGERVIMVSFVIIDLVAGWRHLNDLPHKP